MTVCANCGTNEGPFIKNLGLGDFGPKVCGFPPRYGNVPEKKREERVRQCNARRFEEENKDA
jgi:hypothetical protein